MQKFHKVMENLEYIKGVICSYGILIYMICGHVKTDKLAIPRKFIPLLMRLLNISLSTKQK